MSIVGKRIDFIEEIHKLIERKSYNEAIQKLEEIECIAKKNKKTDDSLYITISYYRLYISILRYKQNNEVSKILESIFKIHKSCIIETMYYRYLLAFAYDLPSDEKQLANQIANMPTSDALISFLINNDEIKKDGINRKFRSARDKIRKKIKDSEVIPAVKDLILKELLERVVVAEDNSDKRVTKDINERKYSKAYEHLRKKARTRIISEEEQVILHLLETIVALQTYGITLPKASWVPSNNLYATIFNNDFVEAQTIFTKEYQEKTLKRIVNIGTLLCVINNDTTKALRDPVNDIISLIEDNVGEKYISVCELEQVAEISLEEAIESLNIDYKIASYIRLYRAYELFVGSYRLTSPEDPRELCEKEIATSDNVVINIIAKYFIKRYSEESQKIGHSPLVKI